MIRDPSDGSVHHHHKPLENNAYGDENPVLDITTSGQPISRTKAEYLERLEKSREWLKRYFSPSTSA